MNHQQINAGDFTAKLIKILQINILCHPDKAAGNRYNIASTQAGPFRPRRMLTDKNYSKKYLPKTFKRCSR